MIISDLNHLEIASSSEIAGGSHTEFDIVRGSVFYTSKTVGLAIGNVAVADSAAGALGFNTFTKAATSTFTTPISSSSAGYSISVS